MVAEVIPHESALLSPVSPLIPHSLWHPSLGAGARGEKFRLNPEVLRELQRKCHLSLAVKARSSICGVHTPVWLTFSVNFHQLLSSQMSQHQLFLLFTSCLCSFPSLISPLLVFFLSFPRPQPAQPFDFLCGPLCSLLTVSLSLGSGLASPFRHHCPRAFGMRPACSAAHPRLFAMGPTGRSRRTEPLPRRVRHSVLGLLGSPLEVRPVGLLVLLLLPVSIPLGHLLLREPSWAPFTPTAWHRLHSTKLGNQSSPMLSDPTRCALWYLARAML